MTNAPEYLRARDIVQLTGVSLRTVRRWIANKILVSGKAGGARLVAKSELERLLSPTRKIDEGEVDDGEEVSMKSCHYETFGKALDEKTSHLLSDSIPERHLLTRPDTFPTEGPNERE
jgi:excisionase family DNA binding protein